MAWRSESVGWSDMAPIMRGQVLKPHGYALIKVCQGAGFWELAQLSRSKIARMQSCGKPTPSKARSVEMYLLAMDFRLV